MVDVCETLELYQTVYELLRGLVNPLDKRGMRRPGKLQGFQGYVGYRELKQMGIAGEILEDELWAEERLQNVINGSGVQGYLFQCLHCKKHLLWVDYD